MSGGVPGQCGDSISSPKQQQVMRRQECQAMSGTKHWRGKAEAAKAESADC